MPRTATTADAFSAVAEPWRREILGALAGQHGRSPAPAREWAVGELVHTLGLAQPAVSKHLGVLRRVGLVRVRRDGQRRMYRLEAQALKPVHDWVKTYEKLWEAQLDRVKEAAEKKAAKRQRPFG